MNTSIKRYKKLKNKDKYFHIILNDISNLKWKDISRKIKDLILYGNDEFDGIITFLNNRYNNTERFWVQYELEKYQSERNCNLCDGYRLNEKALAVKIDGAGCDTMISLRPERVVVNPDSDKFPNRLSAKVEELIYLGDHIRSRMNVCGHDDFIVKIPNSAQHAQLKPGETVQVGWLAEDSRALDVPVSS